MSLSKVKESSNNVINFNLGFNSEKVESGITAGGMSLILDRLTDLYSDPIAATVREVVSNAVDATVAAGTTEPVEIFTPSKFNPEFVVIDHGIGMSTDDVRTIYSQYGASTKSVNFDMVGAYGLGAKAPLAYCNEFFVETTKDSITTFFTFSRSRTGNYVNITLVEDQGRPAGTKVTIPSRLEDVNGFVTNSQIYQDYSFDVPVLVNGTKKENSDYYLLMNDFVLDKETNTTGRVWVRKESLASYFVAASAVKNNNGYRSTSVESNIDVSFVLSGWMYSNPAHNHYRGYNSNKSEVIIELKPGVVDFSSSRDEITLNDRVRKVYENFLTIPKEDAVKAVLDIYKDFSDKESVNFVSAVRRESTFNINRSGIYSQHRIMNSDTKILGLSDLDTLTGFNPIVSLSEDFKNNLYDVFFMTKDRWGSNYTHHFLNFKEESRIFNPFSIDNYAKAMKVTGMTKAFIDDFHDKPLLSVRAAYRRLNYLYGSEKKEIEGKALIVTGTTADDFGKVIRARKTLLEIYPSVEFYMFADNSKSVKSQAADIKKEFGEVIEVISFEKILEKAKEHRSALRAKRAPAKKTIQNAFVLSLPNGDSSAKTVLRSVRSIPQNYTTADAAEIIDSKSVVIFSSAGEFNNSRSLIRNFVVTVANDGIDLKDLKIYVVSNPLADFINEFMDYDRAYTTSSYNPRSKVGEKFMTSHRRATDNALHSVLLDYSDSEIARANFVDATSERFVNVYKMFLEDIDETDSDLYEVMTADKVTIDSAFGYLNDFTDNLNEDTKKIVNNFRDTIQSYYSARWDEIDNRLICNYISSLNDSVLTTLGKAIIGEIHKKYSSKKVD